MKLQFDLSVSPEMTRWGLAGLLLLGSASNLSSESVTLSTYYPAPSGVYSNMITTSDTYLARDGGLVGIGTVSPVERLGVAGGIALTAASPQITFFNTATGPRLSVLAANTLSVGFGATERLHFDSTGGVGVNKVAAVGVKLDVNGSIIARGCVAGRRIVGFVNGVDAATCNTNTEYITWLPGLMTVYQTHTDPIDTPAPDGNFYCCPCPSGACPLLP